MEDHVLNVFTEIDLRIGEKNDYSNFLVAILLYNSKNIRKIRFWISQPLYKNNFELFE